MPDVPRRVQARGPVHVGPTLRVFYQPTNTRRDLPPVPASQKRQAMDAFLLSDDLQDTILEAGKDMANDAAQLAAAEGITGSGRYLSSFEARRGEIVEISDGEFANPRVSVEVSNDAETAAAVEYGNAVVGPGHRILGKIAAQYDNPKDGV